jgi:hypothetical protein
VGSILVSGTNGIVINAATTGAITIRNLTLEGLGTGLSAILILAASRVNIEHVKIHNFITTGVLVNATASVNLTMNDVTIAADNPSGSGVSMTTTSGIAKAELDHVRIWNTHPGLQGKANSVWTVRNSDISFNGVGAKAFEAGAIINLVSCQLAKNVTAVQSAAGSTIRVMSSTLSHNDTAFSPSSGTILSDGLNDMIGNTINGSVSGLITKM